MKLLNTLKALITVLSNRQVGHTNLMQKGTDNYDRPFLLIGYTMRQVKELAKNSKFAKPTSISSIESSSKGDRLPVAIDHYVILEVLEASHQTIESLLKGHDVRNRAIELLLRVSELYQARAHEVESIGLDLLTCKWYDLPKIISTERRLHKAIMAFNTDTAELDSALKELSTLIKKDETN